MPRTAIIIGSKFDSTRFVENFEQQIVKTMYGNVLLFSKDKTIFLPRHGKNRNIPAHRVNHKANICALNLQGVERIIGLNFVSSLNEKIKPGTFIIPDDYIDFNPETFIDLELRSVEPELNDKLRKELKSMLKKLKVNAKDKGVYIQTKGTRYETAAEIKVISKWADIVGRTMASEATLSRELGIPYACICYVDSYAKGVSKKPHSEHTSSKTHKSDLLKIEKILSEFLKVKR